MTGNTFIKYTVMSSRWHYVKNRVKRGAIYSFCKHLADIEEYQSNLQERWVKSNQKNNNKSTFSNSSIYNFKQNPTLTQNASLTQKPP